MMRALRSRRPAALLTLALLIALSGLFLVTPAQPADAQQRTNVWSATLTVDRDDTSFGCHDQFQTQDNCSTALTDNDFQHDGTTHTVVGLGTAQNGAQFSIETAPPLSATSRGALTLHIGTTQLAVSSATVQGTDADAVGVYLWNVADNTLPTTVTWTDNQQVSVSITMPTPVGSSNANLSGLTATQRIPNVLDWWPVTGKWMEFRPGTTKFGSGVVEGVTQVKVRPTAAHSAATIKVGKAGSLATVASGQESAAIDVAKGANVILVEVTAEDGTKKTYTVSISRQDLSQRDPRNMQDCPENGIHDQVNPACNGLETDVFTRMLTPRVIEGTAQSPTKTGCKRHSTVVCGDGISGGNTFTFNDKSHTLDTVSLSGSSLYIQFFIGNNADKLEDLKKLSLIVHTNHDTAARLELSQLTRSGTTVSATYDFSKRGWGGDRCFPSATECTSIEWRGNQVRLYLFEDLRIYCTKEQSEQGSNQCNVSYLPPPGGVQGGSGPGGGQQSDPLTAAFEYMPEEHGGSTFTFMVRFSETLGASYSRTMRPEALAVQQGKVQGVQQVEGGLWEVQVKPNSAKRDVIVTLAGGRDCDTDAGAVCTSQGVPLENTSTATVKAPQAPPGPVGNLRLLAEPDRVAVSWTAPATGGVPARYIVRLTPAAGGKDQVKKPNADKTSVVFKKLDAGAAYEVKVRAENHKGKGDPTRASATLPAQGQYQGGQGGAPQNLAPPTTWAVTGAASAREGSAATLTISLSEAAPSGGVSFIVADSYGGNSTATPDDVGSITSQVTVAQGDTALDIAIPTAGDDLDEDHETFRVTVAAVTEGWIRAAPGWDRATVTIYDDDTAWVTVTPAALEISEDGSGTYTVVLNSQPTADVVITPAISDDGAANFTPASHAFTPSAWSTAKTFTVSGVADDDRDDESVTVSHQVASSDGKYNGIAADRFSVAVSDTTPEPNQEPTVSSPIADAIIVSESGSHQASLAGVFSDGDADPLTITATSSDEAVATVSVAADQSTLTVNARARGTAAITVTAADGRGGTASDEFTVTVKAAPVVAQNLPDLFGVEAEATQEVSLSGVFHDADGDALTISASSLDEGRVTATAQSGGSALTLTGVAPGWATVRVTAQDADGNQVSDAFNVQVIEAPAEPEADDPPPGVANLSCTATTERVVFRWEAPQWSGGELHAYDYDLTLPDGQRGQTRLVGSTSVNQSGNYQVGKEASIGVKAVYKVADGSKVSSEAATLSCAVAG